MPNTKNAYIRYKMLDNCFRNTAKRYFIEDLVEACSRALTELEPNSNGISLRQIQDDIAFMESSDGWGIDLERKRDGKRVYYRYSNPGFSINNMPLNDMEIDRLQTAIGILSQFQGMPQFEWMQELIPKLKQGISAYRDHEAILSFDNNQYLKGIDHLGELYNAIHYKKVLNIVYQPYRMEEMELTIHPYYLKQYNNRWFLFGYNPELEKYDWNLALDRIVSIKEIHRPYHINSQINWREYFEDIIGVTHPANAKTEKVVLHFSGKTGYYIQTKPLHGSQKSKWINDDTLEVTLEVILNYELERLILSYAGKVKVLKPVKLVRSMRDTLKDAVKRYGK